MMTYEEALQHCIFRFISGSHAYGTERPDSDNDVRGVFIAPLHHAFDLFHSAFIGGSTPGQHLKNAMDDILAGQGEDAIEKIKLAMDPENGDLKLSVQTVSNPGVDEELQELRKFIKLASESNPNIVEFLWVDRLILHKTPVWDRIRAARDLFLSRKARHTFSGYAFAQLKRIETHRGYLLHPPGRKPTREDYQLPHETTIAKENQNAILSLPEQWVSGEARGTVIQEKRYHQALDDWNSYQKWERERNPARKAMEAKYGYDIKHATHLIRLCRMGVEILRDGVVNVYRPDRDELRQVLRGEWPYEKVLAEAQRCEALMGELYDKTTLRDRPDHKGISKLYTEICEEHYKIRIGG